MLIDGIKTTLRISSNALDSEIQDLIDAARQDLILAGISSTKVLVESDIDPLVKRAITLYVKANFGIDNPDADRLQLSYESLKSHLSLAGDYSAIP